MPIIIGVLAGLIALLAARLVWIYVTEPDEDEEQDLSHMSHDDLEIEGYFEAQGGNWPNIYSQELARRRHMQ